MPMVRGCKRFGARVLLVFLLWTFDLDLTELAAQDVPTNPDVIELLLAGDFEELGGSDSALADVAVVLRAIEQYGCSANPPDREAATALFRVLLRNPGLSEILATAAAHPAWSRFVAWVAVQHPEDCNDLGCSSSSGARAATSSSTTRA